MKNRDYCNSKHKGLALIALCAFAWSLIHAIPIPPVNSTADTSVPGTLRYAIEQANLNPGSTITFAFSGTGPFVIIPTTDLPDIIEPVTINGYTQPGSFPAFGSSPANILIEIQGTNTSIAGLHLAAGSAGSTILGLAINSCTFTPAIEIDDANNAITGNYIGMNAAGTQALPNLAGIIITSDGNIIGGTTSTDRNVIASVNQSLNSLAYLSYPLPPTPGTIGAGADISIASGNNNIIIGNYLGTNPAGKQALTQGLGLSEVGVYIYTGSNNLIISNLISGNTFAGIVLGTADRFGQPSGFVLDSTVIQNNLIGTDLTGLLKVPNGFGITILNNATNTTISSNTISGNELTGVQVGTHLANIYFGPNIPVQGPTTIVNNLIGVDSSGIKPLGNGRYGIEIHQATTNTTIGNTIGGNVVSANGLDGISISSQATNTTVSGNFIGTDKSGTISLPNAHNGIAIGGAQKPSSQNTIG